MANARAALYPLAAVGLVAVLVILAPKRADTPTEPSAPADEVPAVVAAQYSFVNDLQLPEPPEWALRRRFVDDPVERLFYRAQWAPAEVLSRTDPLYKRLDAAQQRQYMELFAPLWKRSTFETAAHLPRIAAFSIPEAESVVLQGALDPSAYVRKEAARGLLVLDSEAAALRAEELLEDPDETVRREALRVLNDMDTPEAGRVLARYAEHYPSEGIRHVLSRIGLHTEDPDGILVLRRYIDEPDERGQIALAGLARFGDLVAIDRLYALLDQPNSGEQIRALRALRDAPLEILDPERIAPVAHAPSGEVRREGVEFLAHLARQKDPPHREALEKLLQERVSDPDLRVYQAAISGLYALGHKDVGESFLKGILTGSGLDLSNSIEMATRSLRDERAGPLILKRLAQHPDTDDTAVLLAGLAYLGDPANVAPFLDALRLAGPGEPLDSSGVPLSYRAALLLPRLGTGLEDDLVALLKERPRSEVMQRALDAMRALPDAKNVDFVLDLVCDASLPLEVRIAAVDTLAFLHADDVYARLRARTGAIENRELAQRLLRVMNEYL